MFIPDSSGQKIASVQLLADAGNSQLGDYRICQRAAAHALGLCSPYWLNEDATVFINDFISIYTQALSLPSGQETSAVSYNGVQVSCYRNNGTFGIILTYPAPVDNNALFSNSVVTALMLSAINQE